MDEGGTDWAVIIPLLTTGVVAILGALFAGLALLKARQVDATTKKVEVLVNGKSDLAAARIVMQDKKIADMEAMIAHKDAVIAHRDAKIARKDATALADARSRDAHPPQQEERHD